MQKQKRKYENRINLIKSPKYSYIDAFFIFAAVMTIGVLLAVSTLAQPLEQTDQSPGSFGQVDAFSPDISEKGQNINQAPKVISLEPDKSGPQEVGSSINWIANAKDPENDPLSYMFQLNGPSTGDSWQTVKEWSQENIWKWDTASDGCWKISDPCEGPRSKACRPGGDP